MNLIIIFTHESPPTCFINDILMLVINTIIKHNLISTCLFHDNDISIEVH